jgi:hypothetical protein
LLDLLEATALGLEDELQQGEHDHIDQLRIIPAVSQDAALLAPVRQVLTERSGWPPTHLGRLALQQRVAPSE